jgi:hypothetical protein
MNSTAATSSMTMKSWKSLPRKSEMAHSRNRMNFRPSGIRQPKKNFRRVPLDWAVGVSNCVPRVASLHAHS